MLFKTEMKFLNEVVFIPKWMNLPYLNPKQSWPRSVLKMKPKLLKALTHLVAEVNDYRLTELWDFYIRKLSPASQAHSKKAGQTDYEALVAEIAKYNAETCPVNATTVLTESENLELLKQLDEYDKQFNWAVHLPPLPLLSSPEKKRKFSDTTPGESPQQSCDLE